MSSPPVRPQLFKDTLTKLEKDEVGIALERILANDKFAQSDRMGKFLRYIVGETLAGRSDRLKEYPIAIEAFERDESFDPQTSSLVRVEAGRLRTKLHEYYAGDGADDPVIIDLPRGGYVPTFAHQQAPEDTLAPEKLENPLRAIFSILRGHATTTSIILAVVVAGSVWLLTRPVQPIAPVAQRLIPTRQAGIAVLPLRNLTGDPGQDYLSDGMTDAIISHLARSHRLRVASMTSVMHFKNTAMSVPEIGQKLGVGHLVEGSVKRSGKLVQISAKLIDAQSNRHVWVQVFERPLREMPALQNEVAGKVRQSLAGRIFTKSGTGEDPTSVVQPEAYEAYLRGRYFRNKISESGFRKAISYFKHAISIAPAYAPARAELAGCYCLLGGHGFELVQPIIGMPQAKKAAHAALEIDDTLAEPYAYLGIIRLKYDWDWNGAEQHLKKAIELKPNFYRARIFYSLFLEAMGRHEEARSQAELARSINPLSLQAQVNLGWQYLQSGMLERARNQFEGALELESKFWAAHWALGHYYRRQGDIKNSIKSFERAVSSGGGHVLPTTALGHAYAISGQRDAALKMVDKLKLIERSSYVSPFSFATIYVGLREDAQTFEQLDRAYKDRSRSLAWLNVMPEFDRVRERPRFLALIKKIGLPRHDN